MRALGFPEFVFVLMLLGVYGLGIWVIWKFYSVLARMADNLDGIRRCLERQRNSEP